MRREIARPPSTRRTRGTKTGIQCATAKKVTARAVVYITLNRYIVYDRHTKCHSMNGKERKSEREKDGFAREDSSRTVPSPGPFDRTILANVQYSLFPCSSFRD